MIRPKKKKSTLRLGALDTLGTNDTQTNYLLCLFPYSTGPVWRKGLEQTFKYRIKCVLSSLSSLLLLLTFVDNDSEMWFMHLFQGLKGYPGLTGPKGKRGPPVSLT